MHARLVGATVSRNTRQRISTVALERRLCAAQRFVCSMGGSDEDKRTNDGPTAVIERMENGEYAPQLKEKQQRVEALFRDYDPPALEVFESKPRYYRMRSEFTVWHDGDDAYYVMHEKQEPSSDHGKDGSVKKIRMDQFPVASELVNSLMILVRKHVLEHDVLKHKLFQVNFHTTLTGEAMVTMLYHKKLDEDWTGLARKMKESIAGDCQGLKSLHVIGRSRKQKICLDKDEVIDALDVQGRGTIRYVQVEGAFSQPNASTCTSMLGWAVSCTQNSGDFDLLELYCGNGNFTTAVAPNFRRVVATEVSKSAVAAARKNFEMNNVTNVFVARMRSEEFTEGWKSGKEYTRLEGSGLSECSFKTLLVDPPRAGLDPETRKLLEEFENVLYISCNPDTLKRDYDAVSTVFDIKRFAMFDQFPYTNHVECGLYLKKKEGESSLKRQKVEN